MNTARTFAALAISLLISGCIQPAASGGSQESDWAAIVALETQAKSLAKTTGCTSDSQCRSAPVGSRACGGPRYYIAYCASSTDSVTLFTKLAEIRSAENAYNTKYNLASTCEFRMPPSVGITGGECAANAAK